MASPLHRLTGFYLTVDSRFAGCRRERSLSIALLAAFYRDKTVGGVLRSMRCTRGCGGRVRAPTLRAAVGSGGQGVRLPDRR